MTEVQIPSLEQVVAEAVVIYETESKQRALNYIKGHVFQGDYADREVQRQIREQENRILLGLGTRKDFDAPTHLRRFALALQDLSPVHL